MEISMWMFWNIILTLVIAPAVWAFRGLIQEVKRMDILLNKTREEYVTRVELRDSTHAVMERYDSDRKSFSGPTSAVFS